jgi:hypothetical protein
VPRNLERRAVAAAPVSWAGTGKSSCRAPARIVDAEHVEVRENGIRGELGVEDELLGALSVVLFPEAHKTDDLLSLLALSDVGV